VVEEVVGVVDGVEVLKDVPQKIVLKKIDVQYLNNIKN
jgi:hypothetical protein